MPDSGCRCPTTTCWTSPSSPCGVPSSCDPLGPDIQGCVRLNPLDVLADALVDLVTVEEATPFLRRLFSLRQGVWEELPALCIDMPEEVSRIAELTAAAGPGVVYAVWLDYPPSAYGSGYCAIIFFLESAHWSTLALYNKKGQNR